ncbi:hypothetical protein Ocin01_09440 [Orchesella cincta]|uniref:Uncharacterized protein n=1 Tax=Orchesella cincta TaxID=48709 RepID=A0A1D2MWC5_ORCCI|nr:hypothetical protein Ocin01_09440 [Orchesella cincta]
MNKKEVVGAMGYDEKVQRKSIENPSKHHRRTSIPWQDRTPAVKYISAIEKRKASVAGPYDPTKRDPNKPILKKQTAALHEGADGNANPPDGMSSNTNDELENCRNKTELIMEVMTKAERLARGCIDILTFPPAGNQLEVLSRFQGCMVISTSIIDTFSISQEYTESKNKNSDKLPNLQTLINNSTELQKEAEKLNSTANKLHSLVKQRIHKWDSILSKNSDFKVESTKLDYPIYSRKSMPESATVFEHFVDEENRYPVEGYCSITRPLPAEVIHLHCEDFDNGKLCDDVDFVNCPMAKQLDIINIITGHGKELLECSNNCLHNALVSLQNQEIDDAFDWIHGRLSKLQYDNNYDPLCALELKNACGEVAARKAELLNISDQILKHVKWVVAFTGTFLRFTKQSLYGGGFLSCCKPSCSKEKLLDLIGPVGMVGIQIFLPLSNTIAQTVFQLHIDQSSKTATEAPDDM